MASLAEQTQKPADTPRIWGLLRLLAVVWRCGWLAWVLLAPAPGVG